MMRWIFAGCILITIPVLSPQMPAQDVCGVKLMVTTAEGRPIPVAPAELRDESGRVVAQTQIKNGKAEFCDFGFGLHSILVGGGHCAAVELKNVRLRFGLLQTFQVVLNLCMNYGDQGNACFAYFRVSSESGEPLSSVNVSSQTISDYSVTDRYGRVQTAVGIGKKDVFQFTKQGYRPERFSMSCDSFKGTEEKSIILKKIR
jgi:hypothetical protein